MRAYLDIGLKSFSASLAYRSEVWLRLIGNIVTILIQVAIWTAVIGDKQVGGIDLEQMITYSILNTLILSLLLIYISGRVDGSLKTGGIASELVRPLSYPLYLLANSLGEVVYQFLFVVIPSLLLAALFFGIQPPASIEHAAAFVVSLGIVLLLSFFIGYLISLIAFWLLTHFALDWMLGGLMIIFSGSFLPIWFFPDIWATVAGLLPFQYLGYIPAAIYMGYYQAGELPLIIGIGALWVGAFWLVTQLLWWKAVRRLIVHGG